jgi:hypothetical protein
MRRAAVHAYAAPDQVTDLTEIVLISGSDYQYYGSTEDGLAVLKGLTDSVKTYLKLMSLLVAARDRGEAVTIEIK